MHDPLSDIRRRHVNAMRKNIDTLGNIVAMTTQRDAITYRDSGDGWTVLEVLGHLKDFDRIFYDRAVMMRDDEQPNLPAFDHDVLVEEGQYNLQTKDAVYGALRASRMEMIAFFEALTDDQWARTGVHPERGTFSITDAAVQVVLHDVDHTEQITRILAEKLPSNA